MTIYSVSTTNELQQRVANASPGDEIIAEPGTYPMDSRWTINSAGEKGNPVIIRGKESPLSGESSHIEFPHHPNQADDSGIEIRSPYVHFKRFEITGSGWKGLNLDGNPHDCVLEELDAHHNYLWAIMIQNTTNVVVRNCDSHHNSGGSGENSDGFNGTGSNNCLFENCRAWENADDGWDLWRGTDHTLRNCWAWNNGGGSEGDGNGFKLGNPDTAGGGHRVERCVAYNNKRHGFTWNRAENSIEMYNNTSVGNARQNYLFRDTGSHVFVNNISANGSLSVSSSLEQTTNSWNLGIPDPQFRSLDPGSPDFLRLGSESPAIDAGTEIGLPYDGNAPDLGAFEFGDSPNESVDALQLGKEVTLTAATAVRNVQTSLDAEHDGFTESGYLNLEPDSGATAYWQVDVPEAQTYNFEIRYANGSSADRTANMVFAGDYQQITFPQTGEWTAWETLSGTVELPSGEVDFGVETTGQDAGNIDQVRLWPVESDSSRIELGAEKTIEASDAVTNPETDIEQEHSGFNGAGYVQFEPDTGGSAYWPLTVPEARTYNFEIRYANGGAGDRTANMTLAGDNQQITFPQTGSWAEWEILTGTVDLPSGEVDLGIETTGQDAGNIDQIRLWPVELEDTRAEPIGDTPNHGYATPDRGQSDWHKPLNENFASIDQNTPVVDQEGAINQYDPMERSLYIAYDTGIIYVGTGSEWREIGTLS